MHTKEHLKLEETYITTRSWFIVYTVAFIFGIIWTILGENDIKIVFITVAFTCFLRAGIEMEMSARALTADAGH